LDDLKQSGVHYGQSIPAEWFEKRLRAGRDTMQFGLAVSEIRRELEKDGFYLSGRGQKGNQFVILPPSSNADVMDSYARAAADALKRGVILGTGTSMDTLNESERRRHEGTLERMQIKTALIQRSQAVQKVIREHAPKLAEKLTLTP